MFSVWYNVSFLWCLAILALGAGVFAVWAWVLSRRLDAAGRADWAYQVSENMQDLRLTEDAFVRAFKRVNAPRGLKYLAGAIASIMVLSIPAFALIQVILYKVWESGQIEVAKTVKMRGDIEILLDPVVVWEFSIFLAVIAFWVLTIAAFIRQYYKGAPGLMREELAYERAGFMPTRKLTLGPNPVHLDSADFGDTSVKGRKILKNVFAGALGLTVTKDKNWQGSGKACDIYTDGSDMRILVHIGQVGSGFDEETHPFFFAGPFARADDKPAQHTIVTLMPDAFVTSEKIKETGITVANFKGSETSRQCSLSCGSMDFFIYDSRG